MRTTGVIATSAAMKRGDVTLELTIDSMQQSLSRLEGVPIIHGHDPLCLPLGKTEKAWVEYNEDDESLLYNEHYLVSEDPERFIHEPSKTPCVRIPFTDSPKRWVVSKSIGPVVEIDISAIRGDVVKQLHSDIYAFDENMAVRFHDHREELPIALIRFVSDMTLSEALLNGLKLAIFKAAISGRLEAWTLSAAGWVRDTCLPLLRKIRSSRTDGAKVRGFEWDVLAFNTTDWGGPVIELVIPSAHDAEIPEAAITAFAETLELWGDVVVEADKVVLVYNAASGQCEFRFALTKAGGVIGSEACYEEVRPRHERRLAVEEAGTHIFGRLERAGAGEMVMQLYSLKEPPEAIGHLSMSQEEADKFSEWWGEDLYLLRPIQLERVSGDNDAAHFRMTIPQ